MSIRPRLGRLTLLAASLALVGCASGRGEGTGPAVLPGSGTSPPGTTLEGAPGPAPESTRPAPVEEDVTFMRHMILHHAQALEMSALVPDRAERQEVHQLARRIEISQRDEIARMGRWLETRTGPAGSVGDAGHADHADHADHGAHAGQGEPPGHPSPRVDPDPDGPGPHVDSTPGMPGMLSQAQMDRLAAAAGEAFDRLFLELMIFHHEGAIRMVEDLFASPRGGQDSEVFDLASHVLSEQRMEIDRMRAWLGAPPSPPDH